MSQQKDNNKVDKVFDDAFKEVQDSIVNTKSSEIVVNQNEIVETLKERALAETIENGRTSWDKVKEAVNGRYAERLLDIMDNLPDRDFVKVHMKLMEYVNPKIIRKEKISDKNEHKSIQIVIMKNKDEKNEKIIDITPEE